MNSKTKPVILVGLIVVFFVAFLLGFTNLDKIYPSEDNAWIVFIILVGIVAIWICWSLFRFQELLSKFEFFEEILGQALKGKVNQGIPITYKSISDRSDGCFNDLIYKTNESEKLRFFPQVHHLNSHYLLNRLRPLLHVGVQQVPAMLTALGIFFTFIGLVVGINELNLETSETLMEGMTTLLGGVSLAFRSSLAGIFFSFMMLGLTRFYIRRADAVASSIATVAQNIEMLSPEAPQNALFNVSEKSSESANSLRELLDISDAQNEKLGMLGTDLASALSGTLREVLNETISEPIRGMNEQMIAFQQEGLETHKKSLDFVMQKLVKKLDEVLGDQVSAFKVTLAETIAWHKETQYLMERFLQNMKDEREVQAKHLLRREELAQKEQEYLEKHREEEQALLKARGLYNIHESRLRRDTRESFEKAIGEANRLSTTLTKTRTDWGQFADSQNQISKNLESLLKEMMVQEENKFNALKGSIDGLTSWSDELPGQLQSMVSKLMDAQGREIQALTGALHEMKESTEQLPEHLQKSLDQLQHDLHTGLGQSFELFDGSTAKIIDRLSGTYVELKEVLDQLHEEMNRYNSITFETIQIVGGKGANVDGGKNRTMVETPRVKTPSKDSISAE